jgi:hypothetical protein
MRSPTTLSFAAVVGEDAYHYHPQHGMVQGLQAYANLTADDDPLGPPDPVTVPAAVIGSHTALVLP